MITVQELFRRLSLNELSNLSISGEGSGTIIETKRPKIIVSCNEALKRIYARFVLRERTLLIELIGGKTSYRLHPAYARTSEETTPNLPHYIIDNVDDKFTGDLVRVLSAFDNLGKQLPLNEEGKSNSVFTPKIDELQVPNPVDGGTISLSYQAYHPDIVDGELSLPIDIPKFLEGALTAHIAYQVYSSMNTQEAKITAQEQLGNYESICVDIENKNMLGTGSETSTHKFEKNGWI